MATISACAVGSLVAVTRLAPSAMMRPSFAMSAAKGPPWPERTFSKASAMARRMKSADMFAVRNQLASTGEKSQRATAVPDGSSGPSVLRVNRIACATWLAENVSRRGFLKGVVGTSAFVLGVRLIPVDLLASGDVGAVDPAGSMNKAALHPSVYVAIDTDGTAYIVAHRSEMGNGVRTALPRIVADELDADWARVKVVQAAAKQDVPKKAELRLKPRSEWRYIGKDAAGYDLKDFCTGKATYGQDTRMEGMLYASVMHPPVMGSTVKSVDDKEARAVRGVAGTETIPTFKPPVNMQALGGVAVLADNTWSAMQGRKKLKVKWDESAHKVFNSGPYRKELEETARRPGKTVREVGNVDEAFAKGGKVIEAEYYAPLLAHASMEPPAALAVYRDGKVEAWA